MKKIPRNKRAVRLQDVEWSYNRQVNPRDKGRFKRLISKEVNNSEDLNLAVGWLEPREVHLLHHHPDASEFYYIMEGSGKVTVEDEVIEATPGTAIYIPANEKHKIENDGERTMVIILGFNRSEFGTVYDE